MSCRVWFTDTARSDLRAIAFHIAELSKDKALALRFVKQLREQTDVLRRFPECGAIPKDRLLKSSGYRFLSYKEYLIFYLYQKPENTVYIMAVFSAKRDYMRVMRKYL